MIGTATKGKVRLGCRYSMIEIGEPGCYWWLMTLYRKFGIINLLREVVGGAGRCR